METSYSLDFTSGPDSATRLGHERSNLEADGIAAAYNGDIGRALSGESRIRDLKRYLSEYGADPNSILVTPAARITGMSYSSKE